MNPSEIERQDRTDEYTSLLTAARERIAALEAENAELRKALAELLDACNPTAWDNAIAQAKRLLGRE